MPQARDGGSSRSLGRSPYGLAVLHSHPIQCFAPLWDRASWAAGLKDHTSRHRRWEGRTCERIVSVLLEGVGC